METIDNLFFFLDERFEEATRDFGDLFTPAAPIETVKIPLTAGVRKDVVDKKFMYKLGMNGETGKVIRRYTDFNGSVIQLYNHIPAIKELSKDVLDRINIDYNLFGTVNTPVDKPYGIVIPTINRVESFCEGKGIDAGFSSIKDRKIITPHGPSFDEVRDISHRERRLSKSNDYGGRNRRSDYNNSIPIIGELALAGA